MTILKPFIVEDSEQLLELLIKNLPKNIKGGSDKTNSNIFTIPTIQALKRCKFIHFNTQNRISFMIFDFDTYQGKEAKRTFKDIGSFYDYLIERIGYEPTFITKTNKGYQFAYHLKNHIFTNQPKALNYLNAIKEGIIKKVGCDIHGSTRNYGIWRNPLKHEFYYSEQINYELKDFKEFVIPKKTPQQKFIIDITKRQVKNNTLIKGNRNNTIFLSSMIWAKSKKSLEVEDIYSYALSLNQKAKEPLETKEVFAISKSVYNYYKNNKIFVSTKSKKEINEGAMGFEKIKNLEYQEYLLEVKRRQSLAAKRTNLLVGKERKKELMLNAKKVFQTQQKNKNISKIQEAIKELKNQQKKINNSSIASYSGLDRKTVRKYLKQVELGL